MNKLMSLFIAYIACMLSIDFANAQSATETETKQNPVIAIKTDVLYWATSTPNIGIEVALGGHTTLELTGGYNPWTLCKESNRKLRHFIVTPEFRYWFDGSFRGHHIGVNAQYSMYNISGIPFPFVKDSKNSRYQGWSAGAGITYGYTWSIGKKWNMEANIGLGYAYAEYDRYESKKCGLFQETCKRHMFVPTEIGLKFIYLIK